MNWKKGYSASFLAMRVNPKTWQDLEEIKILDGRMILQTCLKVLL